MNKRKVLQKLKSLENMDKPSFYSVLPLDYQIDLDVMLSVYPYILGDEKERDNFIDNITEFYAKDYLELRNLLQSGKTDSWVVAFIDIEFFTARELYHIACDAIKADYKRYGHLTPLTLDIVDTFELYKRPHLMYSIVTKYFELLKYLTKEQKSMVIWKMFGKN
ncbi:MAG: hypothetical protein H8E84_04960 [Flavobacteriales bacterium]|nr:hypothetical protein [Flavobacteriales bacterium]